MNGFFLKTIYMVLNILLAFFMMPFILHTLGDKMYGMWILLGTILSYIAYLDMGISSAVSRFISRAVGRQDMNEINEVSNTSFVVYLFIGIASLFVTLILVLLVGLWIKSPDDLKVARILLSILGLNMAIGFPIRAFGSILEANLRYEISESIMLVELLLRNLLIFIFFSTGCRIIALGMIIIGTSFVSYALYLFFAFRTYKGLRLDLNFFNRNKIKEIFSYSVYAFLNRLAGILISRIDALVITIFISLSAVAHYSIAAVTVAYLSNFIVNANNLIGPVISQDEGRGDIDGIRRKFLIATKFFAYITLFVGTMVILYGCPFIIRWVGVRYEDAYPVLLVLAPCTVIALIQAPSNSVLLSISKHKYLPLLAFTEGILNLLLSIVLVKRYGIVGVALGTAIPMCLMRFFIQPIYVCGILKISKKNYYFDAIGKPIFISMIGILPIFYLVAPYVSPSYKTLFICSIIQFIIYFSFVLAIGLNKTEKNYIFGRLVKRVKSMPLFLSIVRA